MSQNSIARSAFIEGAKWFQLGTIYKPEELIRLEATRRYPVKKVERRLKTIQLLSRQPVSLKSLYKYEAGALWVSCNDGLYWSRWLNEEDTAALKALFEHPTELVEIDDSKLIDEQQEERLTPTGVK